MSIILDEVSVEPVSAKVTDDSVIVNLKDGRVITTPLEWYPRLVHGTPAERNNVEICLLGIHWPDLNEDLSIEGMLAGRRSNESMRSIKKWLGYRSRGEKEPIPELPLPPRIARELENLGVIKPKKKRTAKRLG